MAIDIALGLFIAFLAWRGWRKGLIGELVETVGVVVAVIATVRLYPYIEGTLGLASPWSRIIVAAIIFVAIMIMLTLIGKGIRKLCENASLGTIEKFLGLAFGVFKAGLIIAVLSAVLLRGGRDGQLIVEQSLVARTDIQLFAWIGNFLPDEWEAKVDEALKT